MTHSNGSLNGSDAKNAIASDVPAMIRQVQSLLHKQKLLPPAELIDKTTHPKQQASISKGVKWTKTAKRLQAIFNGVKPSNVPIPPAPRGEPTDGIQASSVPTSQNQTKLWDTISKGDTETTKQKTTEMIHPIRTIDRCKFGNHYFEREITAYDSKEGFYHVVYLDGDQEDMDDNEVKQYKKPIQQYSQRSAQTKPTPSTTPPITMPKGFAMAVKYIESVADHAAFAHQPEIKLQEYAFVGGKIWDEDLKKFAAWKDLANHPNTNIAKRMD